MTLEQLAERLAHLDPGSSLTLTTDELARIFDAKDFDRDVLRAIESFALDHRCTFSYDEHGRKPPCFEKDDIF